MTLSTGTCLSPSAMPQVGWLWLVDDPASYAFGSFRNLSLLFVVAGMP